MSKIFNKNEKHLNFEIVNLPNICYESIFPMLRSGASMTGSDGTVYLYGGSTTRSKDSVYLHSYSLEDKQWKSLPING